MDGQDSIGVVMAGSGKSPAMQLHSGRLFPVLNPSPADIQIGDIAASLSKLCRFGGHCRQFYSVAQHCVHVSEMVPEQDALWGLFHDAAEAYIGDITRPMKIALQQVAPGVVRAVETRILMAVAERFDLPWPMPSAVHVADNLALATERRDLMAPGEAWPGLPPPATARIVPQSPKDAEDAFLFRFLELTGGR